MRKFLHVAAFALIVGTGAAQTIPNNSFENWNYNVWMDPTNFTTANDQYVPYSIPAPVTRIGAGSYHGSYCVSLKTDTVRVGGVKDTTAGYIANGNPGGGGPITGGIPYAQKPTGMRFYYQCAIIPGDTALVIAIFKKAGSAIGICEAKLTGNAGGWTLKTQPATVLLTPDTVVFAAASSNLLVNGFKGYPGSLLILDSVTFTGVASQPALMNGDFESWTTDTAAFPTSWSGSYPGVYQTTDKKGGTYAAEMKTMGKTVFNSAQPGYLTTGYSNNGPTKGGNPFTNQVDTLEFWYKYAPVGSDSANVNIQFKKNGSFVFGTGNYLLATGGSYMLEKIPFNTGSAVDSAIIGFQSTQTYQLAQNHVGSDLKVDNVFYASNPVVQSVNNLPSLGNLSVYPNPVKDVVNINAGKLQGDIQTLSVYDLSGRLLESTDHVNAIGSVISFNMSNYSSDLYIIRITTSAGNYFQKVSKL